MGVYLRWFTLFDRERIEELEAEHAAAPERRVAQQALARDITELTHGRGAAERVTRVSEILFGGDPTSADAQTLADLAAEIPSAPWPETDTPSTSWRSSSRRARRRRGGRRAGSSSRGAST